MYSSAQLQLFNSIIDQPGVAAWDHAGNISGYYIRDIVENDIPSLPPAANIVQGVPSFVNANAGDYHLLPYSLGIDFAPSGGGDDPNEIRNNYPDIVDLDGNPRDIDLSQVPNIDGPRDLGAYEVQQTCIAADTVFCDGFEAQ